MRKSFALMTALVVGVGCAPKEGGKAEKKKIATSIPSGDLESVARARGLTDSDLLGAVKTYNPTGAPDEYIAFFGTGSSGRVAVVGMPSMKILKYIGVFTAEPWQGYAFDDESKAMLKASAREDIQYQYGDSLLPALSMTAGKYDGRAVFVADGANARVGVVSLEDYEAKQIVVNPLLRGSHASLVVTPNTEYVVQNSSASEMLGVKDAKASGPLFRGAVTFWKFVATHVEGEAPQTTIDPAASFSVELPPYLQGEASMGRGASDGLVAILGSCAGSGVVPGKPQTCSGSVVHLVDWKKAASLVGAKTKSVNGHALLSLADAVATGVLHQIALSGNAEKVGISPDGKAAVVTYRKGTRLEVVELPSGRGQNAVPDTFKVPTSPAAVIASIETGAPSVDMAFASNGLYVTSGRKLLRIDLAKKEVIASKELGFEGGRIMIPEADTAQPSGRYAVVMNTKPHGRYLSLGPSLGLNSHLIDISETSLPSLYDASIPQANALAAVALPLGLTKPVVKYKVGTNSRTGAVSPAHTIAGKERVIRDGSRVHVYATLVRSHVTPDFVEVNEGDLVTFHLTSMEQSQDQTHGFTIDTYNVHGSWEPGETASVTFVADRPGVFPFYCTEFCSALHLEMQGYFLVKPKGAKDAVSFKGLSASDAMAFYEYIKKGEQQ